MHKLFLIVILLGLVSAVNSETLCDEDQCNGWAFMAKAIHGTLTQFCWVFDDSVIFGCETSTLMWTLYKSRPAPDTVCHGNYQFSILDHSYVLAGTRFNRQVPMNWYLARLRSNEGSGSFYCSYQLHPDSRPMVFYYNGSYYDVHTDSNGFITRIPQQTRQDQIVMFKSTSDILGCEVSGCCWTQDVYYDTAAYADGQFPIKEFHYSNNLWYIWDNATEQYQLYTGLANKGIGECFKTYQTNLKWEEDEYTDYWAVNGSIFVEGIVNNAPGYVNLNKESRKEYTAFVMKALEAPTTSGTLFITVEDSLFAYISGTVQRVHINNGEIEGNILETLPIDPDWSVDNVNSSWPRTCNLRKCSGNPFYAPDTTALLCLTSDHFLTFCDEDLGYFVPVSNRKIPNNICVGNFKFTIVTTNFWLNGSKILRSGSNGQWSVHSTNSFLYSWYLARLRPHEGSGTFFCSYNKGPAFYYDGSSYFDIETNALGYIVKTPREIPIQPVSYFLINQNLPGCRPVCCWFTDNYVKNTGAVEFTEITYHSNLWWAWSDGKWIAYSGEFNSGISRCSAFLSSMKFKTGQGKNEILFDVVEGTVYRSSEEEVNGNSSTSMVRTEVSYVRLAGGDPLTTGGFYSTLPAFGGNGSQFATGLYQNVSGLWWTTIKEGRFYYRKKPPNCNGNETEPPTSWSCFSTDDTLNLARNDRTVCDPFHGGNTCGEGYFCQHFSHIFAGSCSLGLCVPNYRFFCSETTTTTSPITTTTTTAELITESDNNETTRMTTTTSRPTFLSLQRYGDDCYFDSNCYTHYCRDGKCVCPSCTKILPEISYIWRQEKLVYKELCIPENAFIGGINETCDMWSAVPARYCGFGLHCSKCPEVWNCVWKNATCSSYNVSSVFPKIGCPRTFKCGYKAKCKMLDRETPVCFCPAGYNLENNLKDCYGWKVSSITACSAPCGNGKQNVTRECDKAEDSTATCHGDSVISVPCRAPAPCLIDDSLAVKVVRVKLKSKVLSVELFDYLLEVKLKAALAKAITGLCMKRQSLYEAQCCNGQSWSENLAGSSPEYLGCIDAKTGISFHGKYFDGQKFTFLVSAAGDHSSPCCHGNSGNRRKRASDGYFDQEALAAVLNEGEILSTMTGVLHEVDPNIVPIMDIQMVTTTTTTVIPGNSAVGHVPSQGIPMWVFGAIGGAVVVFIVIGIAVAIFIAQKMKAKRENKTKPNAIIPAHSKTMSAQPRNMSLQMPGYREPPSQSFTARPGVRQTIVQAIASRDYY